jgi:hypothetical protein
MTLKDALKRIEELERKVAQLEARPFGEHHYHYHYGAPQTPAPTYPWSSPVIWAGGPTIGANEVQWTDGIGNSGTYKIGAA